MARVTRRARAVYRWVVRVPRPTRALCLARHPDLDTVKSLLPKLLNRLRRPKTMPALLWKNIWHPFVQHACRRARPRVTVPAAFFEATYQQNPDPWNFAAYAENAVCPNDTDRFRSVQ